jgi:hypothetical protein
MFKKREWKIRTYKKIGLENKGVMNDFLGKMRKFLIRSAQVFKITLKTGSKFQVFNDFFGFFQKMNHFFRFFSNFDEFAQVRLAQI